MLSNQQKLQWQGIRKAPTGFREFAINESMAARGLSASSGFIYRLNRAFELLPHIPVSFLSSALWVSVDLAVIGPNPLLNLLTAIHACRAGKSVLIAQMDDEDLWPYSLLDTPEIGHFVARAFGCDPVKLPPVNPHLPYDPPDVDHVARLVANLSALLNKATWSGSIQQLPPGRQLTSAEPVPAEGATEAARPYWVHPISHAGSATPPALNKQRFLDLLKTAMPKLPINDTASMNIVFAHRTVVTGPYFNFGTKVDHEDGYVFDYPGDISPLATGRRLQNSKEAIFRNFIEDVAWPGVFFSNRRIDFDAPDDADKPDVAAEDL